MVVRLKTIAILFVLFFNINVFSCCSSSDFFKSPASSSISDVSSSLFSNNPFLTPECLEFLTKHAIHKSEKPSEISAVSESVKIPKSVVTPVSWAGCLASEKHSPVSYAEQVCSNDPFDPIHFRVKSPLVMAGGPANKQ